MSGFFVIFWVGLSVRLFQIQIIDGDELRAIGIDQGEKEQVLNAVRGNIYDRKDAPITQNIIHYSFAVRPNEINSTEEFAETFKKIYEDEVFHNKIIKIGHEFLNAYLANKGNAAENIAYYIKKLVNEKCQIH